MRISHLLAWRFVTHTTMLLTYIYADTYIHIHSHHTIYTRARAEWLWFVLHSCPHSRWYLCYTSAQEFDVLLFLCCGHRWMHCEMEYEAGETNRCDWRKICQSMTLLTGHSPMQASLVLQYQRPDRPHHTSACQSQREIAVRYQSNSNWNHLPERTCMHTFTHTLMNIRWRQSSCVWYREDVSFGRLIQSQRWACAHHRHLWHLWPYVSADAHTRTRHSPLISAWSGTSSLLHNSLFWRTKQLCVRVTLWYLHTRPLHCGHTHTHTHAHTHTHTHTWPDRSEWRNCVE